MKKSKDVLGDIFRGILLVGIFPCVLCIIAGIADGNFTVGMSGAGGLLGCLFSYWLITAITKIVTNLKEINENSSVIRAFCESQMNTNVTLPVPEPTNTENKQ